MKAIPIGYDTKGAARFYRGPGHLLLVAPPRSGKARDILVPALLQYGLPNGSGDNQAASCIVIDPKGQLAAVTGPQRARMGQRVIILNPFGIRGDCLAPDTPGYFKGLEDRVIFNARYNPMASLDHASKTFGADCDNIADALVMHDGGDRESHWSDSARGLMAGLIGHLVANEESGLRNLATVRRAIASPVLLEQFAKAAQNGLDDSVGEALEAFTDNDAANKGELSSIISTARTQTRFMRPEAIAESLSGSDFDFGELKRVPTTVYLVLPVRYLASCGKWFRLILASALDALLNEESGLPVLCIMDEFAQLGRLAVIENTLGLAAGLGLQLWPILQDLTQLKDLYPRRWETFLGCAGVQMFFAPREFTTSDEISKLCGDKTIRVAAKSLSLSENKSAGSLGNASEGRTQGTSETIQARRAMLPQEIRQMTDSEFLLFVDVLQGQFSQMMRKPYWKQTECHDKNGRPLFCPDPYHKPALQAVAAAEGA